MPDSRSLALLDCAISNALAALRGARAAADHSPSADTLRDEELAEQHLNQLLEQWLDLKASDNQRHGPS